MKFVRIALLTSIVSATKLNAVSKEAAVEASKEQAKAELEAAMEDLEKAEWDWNNAISQVQAAQP